MEIHEAVRRIRPDEIETASTMIRNTLLLSNSRDYELHIIERLAQSYSPEYLLQPAGAGRLYVHFDGARIDGTIGFDGERISALFVSPDRQGKGVGSRLLEFVEERARAGGRKRIVVDASLTAAPFYRKNGYRYVARKRNQRHGDVYAMEKKL